MPELERIPPQDLADVRRILTDPGSPGNAAGWFPRAIVEGLLGEIDHLAGQLGSPDELDAFIREQAAADPHFAAAYLHSNAAARLRAVRARHHRYRDFPDEPDCCEYCSRIAERDIPYPCETLRDVGEQDGFESLLEDSTFGSPQARAIRDLAGERIREDYTALNGGVPVDIMRPLIDRHAIRWCCMGFFRMIGDADEQPMMSTMDGKNHDYTLRSLIEQRGPVRTLEEHEYSAPIPAQRDEAQN